MKINCIAIDDEPLALEKIRDYINQVGYLNLLTTFPNGIDALEYIKREQVDLIFLDIQMKVLSGIQFMEALKAKPKIILTTAYDQYALKGYELEVCDYLLKPISFTRFLQACDKVYDLLAPNKNTNTSHTEFVSNSKSIGYFFVKNGQITQKISHDDILFVQGVKDYLRIWTKKEKIMTLLSFRKLQEFLPSSEFIRVHNSYLVSINKIEKIERNRVIIAEESIPIGGSYKREFLKIINDRKL